MTLHTTPAAEGDLAYYAARLEAARAGQGVKLFRAYRDVAEAIERFPQMYPTVEDAVEGVEVRNALLGRFELRAIYVVRDTDAVVVAVAHARRLGGSWHGRLTDLTDVPEEP